MKVISYNVETISRGEGRSVVQFAAYCARSKIYCEYTGISYDHRGQHDLIYHEIMLPDQAPRRYEDPEVLWNEVEKVERSKNARLARTVRIVLPNELPKEAWVPLIRQHVDKQFVGKGMCADWYIHDKGEGNPHVHIILTTRSIDKDGNWMLKQRRNYLLNDKGERIIDSKTGKPVLGKSIKINNWDEQERIEEWRKSWADCCNDYFREHDSPVRLTHLSYERQGIDKIPQIHLGARAKALEDRGIRTERGDINRRIKQQNRIRARQRNHSLDKDWKRDSNNYRDRL